MSLSTEPPSVADVATTSRSWSNYVDMFDLSRHPLPEGPVLVCPAGAGTLGPPDAMSVAVDPVYAAGAAAAAAAALEFEQWLRRSPRVPSANDLRLAAERDAGRAEFAERSAPLVAAQLPDLPFRDGAFSVALCSHLLFCYPQLGRELHLRAVAELLRVSGEVRIFPLLPGVRGGGVDATPEWFADVWALAGSVERHTSHYGGHDHHTEFAVLRP
jgi:hypothetical protein